jgi:uncharacterized protein YuzE
VYSGVNEMKISFDRKADALYIRFRAGKFFKNKVLDDQTILDLDKKGQILGIEVLNATKRINLKGLRTVAISRA